MNRECDNIILEIQELMDSDTPLSPEIQKHLERCSSCRNFVKNISDFTSKFKNELNRDPGLMQDPDFSNLPKETGKKKNHLLIAGAASIFVCIFSVFSYFSIMRYTTVSYIKADNIAFIEELYSSSFFSDIEGNGIFTNSSDWFSAKRESSGFFEAADNSGLF